ncbi:ATP-binding protein [Streptomyces gilvosporeus]|uniref:ATP-binding protein n=1 Tax=Streptomyces gilvosporeus TaxID=553510 RepID=A0A1V0TRZ8_9ACTN|nr:ATP-binding protein [Streptomyces gilvosporeus]ARF55729.1 ATP-binding protein [Streptomyces gilvosporeus]
MPEIADVDATEPWEYSLYIPHDPRAVPITRHTLRLVLTAHGLAGFIEVAELLASELITNAVRHTKGPAALRIHWADGILRIGAWDTDPAPPALALRLTNEVESGRGLDLVHSCADKWGWYPLLSTGDLGKYVWCELAAAA